MTFQCMFTFTRLLPFDNNLRNVRQQPYYFCLFRWTVRFRQSDNLSVDVVRIQTILFDKSRRQEFEMGSSFNGLFKQFYLTTWQGGLKVSVIQTHPRFSRVSIVQRPILTTMNKPFTTTATVHCRFASVLPLHPKSFCDTNISTLLPTTPFDSRFRIYLLLTYSRSPWTS